MGRAVQMMSCPMVSLRCWPMKLVLLVLLCKRESFETLSRQTRQGSQNKNPSSSNSPCSVILPIAATSGAYLPFSALKANIYHEKPAQ